MHVCWYKPCVISSFDIVSPRFHHMLTDINKATIGFIILSIFTDGFLCDVHIGATSESGHNYCAFLLFFFLVNLAFPGARGCALHSTSCFLLLYAHISKSNFSFSLLKINYFIFSCMQVPFLFHYIVGYIVAPTSWLCSLKKKNLGYAVKNHFFFGPSFSKSLNSFWPSISEIIFLNKWKSIRLGQ